MSGGPILPYTRPIRHKAQHQVPRFLCVENRSTQQGERFSSQLGQRAKLVEPTFGVDPQGAQQFEGGQGHSPSLFTDMACKAMVEKNVGDDDTGRSSDEEPEHFKKPARQAIVPPTLVNFFTTLQRDNSRLEK